MNTGPLVSVIVPVHDVLPYLGQALDSVLAQAYRDLEIIVVDNGSTDGSGELCDEYAHMDGRLTVIHQENRGLSAARNVGLDRATGDWILFLDSDDWMEPNAVEALLREADATGADIVCCQSFTEQAYASTSPRETQRALRGRRRAFRPRVLERDWSICVGQALQARALRRHKLSRGEGVRGHSNHLARRRPRLSRRPHTRRALHYRMRQGSIAHDRSMANLADYWTAYAERYRALAGRSNEYRHATIEQCVAAIGRTWSWCIKSPRKVRRAHADVPDEMSSFAREHTKEVLRDPYPLRTKALCIAGRWKSPFVWRAMHAANSLRHRLRRQQMYT